MLSRLWVKLVPYSISVVSHREFETGNWKLHLTCGKYFHFSLSYKTCWVTFQICKVTFSFCPEPLGGGRERERGTGMNLALGSYSHATYLSKGSYIKQQWVKRDKKAPSGLSLLKKFRLSTWWILFDKRIKRNVVSRGSCWGSHGLHNRQSTSHPPLLSPPCFVSSTWLKWKTQMPDSTQIFSFKLQR